MILSIRKNLFLEALKNKEGIMCHNGALVVTTGSRTGRSPKDRFIVQDDITALTVDWNETNQPISIEHFKKLWSMTKNYLSNKKTYSASFLACSHPHYTTSITATTEFAWHMLFLTNLLLYTEKADHHHWELIAAPKLKLDIEKDSSNSDGIVAIDMLEKKILIIGIEYAGEIKKSIFSAMNYWLPEQQVLSMHCAANKGKEGKVTLFFGLSGTGKTTLSADNDRFLIGDDEHGWHSEGIFNIENGCYAKCFGLSYEKEPIIFNAIKEYSILENVVLHDNQQPNYEDASITLNTRAAYPLDYVVPRSQEASGNNPSFIFMLSCDLFGILPAISKLSVDQALFWFLTGYTAHMGSTEYGESGIKPTFSTCFGAPFFPRKPETYALMLERNLKKNCDVYLINTGYFAGTFKFKGKRYPLHITRKLIECVHKGKLKGKEKLEGPFGLSIPKIHIDDFIIQHPMQYWDEPELYINTKNDLQNALLMHFKKLNISESFKERMLDKGFCS